MTLSKRKKIALALISILVALLIIMSLGYYRSYRTLDKGLEENKVDALPSSTLSATSTSSDNPAPQLKSENILVLGSDLRSDPKANIAGARSDTMLIMHLSADRKSMIAVSIPRDLMVRNAPSCQEWDARTRKPLRSTWNPSRWVQANSAFAMGGPACAVKMAESLSGLKIKRYVEVDFNGFKALVDAVGGVTLNICAPMKDTNNGEVLFSKPGVYNLNGSQALRFARIRYVEGSDGSDTGRMQRQQFLIKQVIEQKLNSSILWDSNKINDLATAFVENTKTDNVDVRFLIDSAVSSRGLTEVNMFTLPTTEWDYDHNRLVDNQTTTSWLFSQVSADKTVTEAQAQAKFKQEGLGIDPAPAAPSKKASHKPSATTTVPPVDTPKASPSQLPCAWGK